MTQELHHAVIIVSRGLHQAACEPCAPDGGAAGDEGTVLVNMIGREVEHELRRPSQSRST